MSIFKNFFLRYGVILLVALFAASNFGCDAIKEKVDNARKEAEKTNPDSEQTEQQPEVENDEQPKKRKKRDNNKPVRPEDTKPDPAEITTQKTTASNPAAHDPDFDYLAKGDYIKLRSRKNYINVFPGGSDSFEYLKPHLKRLRADKIGYKYCYSGGKWFAIVKYSRSNLTKLRKKGYMSAVKFKAE